jgi:hypothetical protein
MYKIADVQVAKISLTAALDAVGGQINALATLPITITASDGSTS